MKLLAKITPNMRSVSNYAPVIFTYTFFVLNDGMRITDSSIWSDKLTAPATHVLTVGPDLGWKLNPITLRFTPSKQKNDVVAESAPFPVIDRCLEEAAFGPFFQLTTHPQNAMSCMTCAAFGSPRVSYELL
jgi:hypothetical protein